MLNPPILDHTDLDSFLLEAKNEIENFNNKPSLIQPSVDVLIFEKQSDKGIKVDTANPNWAWGDILTHIQSDGGPNSPALTTYRGGVIKDFAFKANDVCYLSYHLPHDYKLGTNLYWHFHWSHNGTSSSGDMVIDIYMSYAKGWSRGSFSAEKNITITTNTSTATQYQHNIVEVPISVTGGSSTLLDTSLIEPDGIIQIAMKVTTIPTITGGHNQPFIHFADIHYQSTGIGTKQRNPDFYT